MELLKCGSMRLCNNKIAGHCKLIPGACEEQMSPILKPIQECCLCSHRNVCKYREDFEKKKSNTYIKLECKYFKGV